MTDNILKVFSEVIKPQRIVLARESRGLLQSELARKINVSQGKLSKMESGVLEVSKENLESLSKVLSYPKGFFYEPIERYSLGLNFYRKNKGLTIRVVNAIQSFIDLRRNEVEKFLRSIEYSFERTIPFCDSEDAKYGTPEIIANSIRKFWNVPRGAIKNMVELLESAGIIIIPCDFGNREFSGVGTWTNDGIKLIFINKQMPGDRIRFTLAHELGHFVMHRFDARRRYSTSIVVVNS
jgi:transcriptional regulator with XRE-family HTH domain